MHFRGGWQSGRAWHYLLSICRMCPLPGLRIDPLLFSNNRLNLPTISRIVPFTFFPVTLFLSLSLVCVYMIYSSLSPTSHTSAHHWHVSTCACSHKVIYTIHREHRCSNYESRRESARPENCSLFSPDHRGWGGIRRPVFERFDTGSAVPDESLNSSSLSRHPVWESQVSRTRPRFSYSSACLPWILSCRSSCSWHAMQWICTVKLENCFYFTVSKIVELR